MDEFLRKQIEEAADQAWEAWKPDYPLASYTDGAVFRAGYMAAVERILRNLGHPDPFEKGSPDA